MTLDTTFTDFFAELWGYPPFPWQRMLAERVATQRWPEVLDLPTAAGKTACIDIAVFALATQATRKTADRTAPRRVWFVVDRRIVVDEAFTRASEIANRLENATKGPLKQVADALRDVSGTPRALAVARLRGGVLRDDSWARLPSQPAVITSTVDQLGSRLLFRGYGRGNLTASIFAGLAAHDSLIILDEAHCSVPFLQTLRRVEKYRESAWAETPMITPFAFSILSATPPAGTDHNQVFPGRDQKSEALDHDLLRRRLDAVKPAQLVEVKPSKKSPADALIVEADKRTKKLLGEGKTRIALIVNRVRTAETLAKKLSGTVGEGADVVLLTGRIRPYERDQLVAQWKPFLAANRPQEPQRPIVLVATQCIEVGADFSFDALITEVASLDALRQRFGRVDRMGDFGNSTSCVLARSEDIKKGSLDPIYGEALAATWQLLQERAVPGATKKDAPTLNFGFSALDAALEDMDDLTAYLAPTADAPVLLPAHIDQLCQTAPVPTPEPDIALFLHGKDRGSPEARVVWRCDLSKRNDNENKGLRKERDEAWRETVALCPPVSGETLSVSLYHLRKWLAQANKEQAGDAADVVGLRTGESLRGGECRPFLLWQGRDRSRVHRSSTKIRQNDVVVVPADYGIDGLGQAVGPEGAKLDLWEKAWHSARKSSALRLHRSVLGSSDMPRVVKDLLVIAEQSDHDRQELVDAIDTVVSYKPDDEDDGVPAWLLKALRETRRGRKEAHPDKGVVLFAPRSRGQASNEMDMFADDDDLLSTSGTRVSLNSHSQLVEQTAKKIASRCLPDEMVRLICLSAWWHDVGKLDQRFQTMLYEGDLLAAVGGESLAKSRRIPSSPSRRLAIREMSGLPLGFRHEMLSAQLAEKHAVLPASPEEQDLFLHLVASHHGFGRPFAPVVLDAEPPAVTGQLGDTQIELSSAARTDLPPAHRLDSGVADRFWRLTRRHGWWGLAYLEAVVRLADWYGSAHVIADERDRDMEAAS